MPSSSLGTANRRKAIAADLEGRKRGWLLAAATRATDSIRGEQAELEDGAQVSDGLKGPGSARLGQARLTAAMPNKALEGDAASRSSALDVASRCRSSPL